MNPAFLINMGVCTILCIAFFAISVLINLIFFRPQWKKATKDELESIVLTNIYSIVMAVPAMPFVYGESLGVFSVTIISIFSLASFVWQLLFVQVYYKANWKQLFIPLSLSILPAWFVMSFVNHFFYGSLVDWIHMSFMQ